MISEIYSLKNIDKLLSFGSACKTKFQIDRYLLKVKKNYNSEAFYFDWLMVGELKGAINLIRRGFYIDHSFIKLHEFNKQFIPRDIYSNHLFLHDFGFSGGESNLENAKKLLENNIDEGIKKYQYLGEKTHSILKSNQRIGIVYYGNHEDSLWNELTLALKSTYRKKFLIINVLEKNVSKSNHKDIITIFVDDDNLKKVGTEFEWQGSEDSWYQAFSSLKIDESSYNLLSN